MKKIIISFLLLVPFLSGFSQSNWQEITKSQALDSLQKIIHYYTNNTSYSITTHITSFEDYLTLTPFESSSGYFEKTDHCIHSFSMGIKTVQDSSLKIIIDSVQQILLIDQADPTPSSNIEQLNFSIEHARKISYSVKKQETTFSFLFSDSLEISKVTFVIQPNGFISKYIIFYNLLSMSESGDVEIKKPRVEFLFNSNKLKKQTHICGFDRYIRFEGSNIIAQAPYLSYQLIDNRRK
jgi:hypothetical protein